MHTSLTINTIVREHYFWKHTTVKGRIHSTEPPILQNGSNVRAAQYQIQYDLSVIWQRVFKIEGIAPSVRYPNGANLRTLADESFINEDELVPYVSLYGQHDLYVWMVTCVAALPPVMARNIVVDML